MRTVVALFLPLLLQDKSTLEIISRKGDKFSTTFSESTSQKATSVRGGRKQDTEQTTREILKTRDEVLEVKHGRAVKIQRKVVEGWDEVSTRDPKKQPHKLEGRTLTLVPGGIEGARESLGKEGRRHRIRPAFYLSAFPKEELAAGATWTVDERTLLEDLSADEAETKIVYRTAKAKGKLVEVKSRVASITFEIEATGRYAETLDITSKARIAVRLNIDTDRPVDVKGESTMVYKGEWADGGEQNSADGKVESKFEMAWSYD